MSTKAPAVTPEQPARVTADEWSDAKLWAVERAAQAKEGHTPVELSTLARMVGDGPDVPRVLKTAASWEAEIKALPPHVQALRRRELRGLLNAYARKS